jgi:glycosyltransferase involved in cell wall biosynthesis
MLIGIDASRALRSRRTGTENYSLQLIRQLLRLEGGHIFRLYCDQPPPSGLFGAGPDGAGRFETCVIPAPRLWTHLRLSAEVTQRPPDVLFVPSHVLPVLHPKASVVTVHDLGFRYFPEAHPRLSRWYLDASTRFNARSAATVLADSQATRDDLARLYGIAPDRIAVVYLGRDETLAPARDPLQLAAMRERLGLMPAGQPCPYLLYVGTIQPRKNLERLVEAFARALPACEPHLPGLRLVLAGQQGWLAKGTLQKVAALGLHERVILPGYVAGQDLPALLSAAEAFVFPSLYEGFGFPVLEAQACGTAVLASNTSSLPEVAGAGALLVDPLDVDALAQGLVRLLTEDGLRPALVAAGFANLHRFSWDHCARETLAVLEQAAGGRA